MGLSPLQRQRFIYLLGPRYKDSHKVKLVCTQYNTFHENYIRVLEILREIYWEAKRAPDTNVTAIKNPYRKEQLIKKFFGKTKEERKANYAKFIEEDLQHRLAVEAEELGLEEQQKVQNENMRKKRRELAAKRL